MLSAQIAKVRISSEYEIEGLMGEDGEFYVGASQVATLFSLSMAHASRDIKALLGGDFQLTKMRTNLNSKAVNVLTLSQFEMTMTRLSFRQNPVAMSIREDLVGLGLRQLFCDAFGVKFEAEEREEWLKVRAMTKQLYRELADRIQIWQSGRECSAPEWTYYANAFDAINVGLFGKKAKTIREELGLSSGWILQRDYFGPRALYLIQSVQGGAARYMEFDSSVRPVDAVNHIIAANFISVVDYNL
jgi:hypothetical protein